jgi:hypothetical protein
MLANKQFYRKESLKCSVFVTGSGYSGSGFVLDFLREQESVSILPFRPFRYACGDYRTYLHNEICELFSEKNPTTARALAREICTRLEQVASSGPQILAPGALQSFRRAKRAISLVSRRGKAFWNPEIKSLPQPGGALVKDFEIFREIAKDEDRTDSLSVAETLAGLYRGKVWDGDWVEHIQDIIAIDKSVPTNPQLILSLLEMASPAKIILVIRNPLDQFADFFRCEVRSQKEQLRFFSQLEGWMNDRATFNQSMTNLAKRYPSQVAIVDFDSLVLHHEKSLSILAEWIGFTPTFFPYRNFDLRRSAANVGIQYEFMPLRDRVLRHDVVETYLAAREVALAS